MYYWTIVNKDTGEVFERNKGCASEDGAYRSALRFLGYGWRNQYPGKFLIEIWSFPEAYSSPQHVLPMSSRVYRRDCVDVDRVGDICDALELTEGERRKLFGNLLRDSHSFRREDV